MRLRRLNEAGIDRFRERLDVLRQAPEMDIAHWRKVLEDPKLTELHEEDADMPEQKFSTRREFTEMFRERLGHCDSQSFQNDAGMWAWLSMFYFDSVCPKNACGTRKVLANKAYIFIPKSRDSLKHLLYDFWQISNLAIKYQAEKYVWIWLDESINSIGLFTAETMKRLSLTRLPCFFELIYRLYWDEQMDCLRPGILKTRKDDVRCGDLTHRLPSVLNQLAVNYDLQNLTAEQLIPLLGPEFLPDKVGTKP